MEADSILFDALRGHEPTLLFGACLEGESLACATRQFFEAVTKARAQVLDAFGVEIVAGADGVSSLDGIIKEMWDTGWSPDRNSLDLFMADFGVLFAAALLGIAGAAPVFRSSQVIDHMSVWLPQAGMEVFPIHKVLKCLRHSEGENLGQVFRSAAGEV